MADLSANIRLRPTRIGFLVRPTDLPSIRKIMQACTCLWGGIYNPIIPVFKVPPRAWRGAQWERVKGPAIAKGYIEFFEPDVYVESEEGLLEEAGLGALREKITIEKFVVGLDELFQPQYSGDPAEPVLGLTMIDVLRHLFKTERRFQSRKETTSVLVRMDRGSALVEAIFGAFPTQKDIAYFSKSYVDVLAPEKVEANAKTWIEVFKKGAETPLRITRYGLDAQRYWNHDLVVYVFDPTRPTDLIDLWNLRLEPRPVLPVPVGWFNSLADEIQTVLKQEHRPIRGNPHGVMHHATVEFGRSIAETKAKELVEIWKGKLPAGALVIKLWRNSIWTPFVDDRIHRDRRLKVTANERRTTVIVNSEKTSSYAEFETLSPEFASRFGGHTFRWVNAVQLSSYRREGFGITLPFNIFDRRWPAVGMGGDRVQVGSEGWIFGQRTKGWNEHFELLSAEEAILSWLKQEGIEAKLSDPGHIAKQMLEHLGSLWAIHLLADLETIQLLNKMAGGVRVRKKGGATVEETFERRTASVKKWIDLISKRKADRRLPRLELADFTSRNVIRLGLETDCPNCHATNWHSLAAVDYAVVCERCLHRYDFPQAELKDRNQNWHYRVVGPFSVPDYGRGSYSALLCLRFLKSFSVSTDFMTYLTATDLKFDGLAREVDFIAWRRKERFNLDEAPDLIVGEAKSAGQGELITQGDLTKLKEVAQKLPGAFIVLSVLRNDFTSLEKTILRQFAKWGRRRNDLGRVTNPVILLTSRELFFDHLLSATWKDLGKPWSSFSEYDHTRNLYEVADATQQIYLGLPSFSEWERAKWEKRTATRKKMTNKP
jgi:hypothetical protein